ncbi:hypothetical protein CHGG_05084 [Chaetomium globosum CBS 148.51]|uniref:NAD(P)-binding domain-containing protein n=1 Tax=Chaetomium globosum (strain ATCC 6205 / CBS 148.51 / DSM 1962 / NBRC 6347 / NRRL 1970) TaxID=306901 RepID=Q2GZG2_CHAGB|nr:uncharacterized protein CHGG_05084 [Chaetomium globosum CBS 148.51]EAQ88465.1 hypothetical protein CHGG_05084 [Chaetomium globosum CBS 148.51]
MHLILTGATGLVGTAVLDAMIRTKDITKISVLSRRPVKFTDDRINVIIHQDFASYDHALLEKLKDAKAAEAFQSLPSKAGTKEPFHFVYVSGDGATFTPGRLTPIFGRVKGEAELALAEMQKSNPSSLRASTVRPSFVDWTGHEEIKPFLPEIGMLKSAAGSILSPMMKYVGKSRWSPTAPLGKFLTGMAMAHPKTRHHSSSHGVVVPVICDNAWFTIISSPNKNALFDVLFPLKEEFDSNFFDSSPTIGPGFMEIFESKTPPSIDNLRRLQLSRERRKRRAYTFLCSRKKAAALGHISVPEPIAREDLAAE